jgi:predicted transcriptional regulator
MSNRTSMAQINAIGNLYRSGLSNRQIAKLLGVNRETVGKYVAAIKAAGTQNQPNPQTGFRQAKQLICQFSVAAKNINSAATNLPTTILNYQQKVAGFDPQNDRQGEAFAQAKLGGPVTSHELDAMLPDRWFVTHPNCNWEFASIRHEGRKRKDVLKRRKRK